MYRLLFLILLSFMLTEVSAQASLKDPVVKLDATDRSYLEKQSPQTLKKLDLKEQLSTQDIKKMVHAGLSDNVIMKQIDETNSIFYLSAADIVDLQKAAVSQTVINYMIRTGNR